MFRAGFYARVLSHDQQALAMQNLMMDEIVHGDPVGQPRPLFTPVNLRKAFSRDLDWSGIRRQRIHLKSCTVFQQGDHRHGTKLLSRVSYQMMHADS